MRQLLFSFALCGILAPVCVVPAHGSSPPTEGSAAPVICFSNPHSGWVAEAHGVLHTVNGGKKWPVSLSVRFRNTQITWTPSIGCSGATAWVLWAGNAQTMNQRPYVIYHTRNDGKTWKAVFTEGYFSDLYPRNARNVQRTIGASPGPFTVVNPSSVYFIGLSPVMSPGKQVQITGTTNGTRWHTSFIPCLSDLWPLSMTFADPSHGWVAGTCSDYKRAIVATVNGGRTWTVQTQNA